MCHQTGVFWGFLPKNGCFWGGWGEVLLGVGFFQQRAPELGALGRVHEEQLPVLGGQKIVHDHVQPLAELPDLREGEEEEEEDEDEPFGLCRERRFWGKNAPVWGLWVEGGAAGEVEVTQREGDARNWREKGA